jgi:hypothetical protein
VVPYFSFPHKWVALIILLYWFEERPLQKLKSLHVEGLFSYRLWKLLLFHKLLGLSNSYANHGHWTVRGVVLPCLCAWNHNEPFFSGKNDEFLKFRSVSLHTYIPKMLGSSHFRSVNTPCAIYAAPFKSKLKDLGPQAGRMQTLFAQTLLTFRPECRA